MLLSLSKQKNAEVFLQGEQLRESVIQCQILKNSTEAQEYEITTVSN